MPLMPKTSPPNLRTPKSLPIDMYKSSVSVIAWGEQASEDVSVIELGQRHSLKDKISQEILGVSSLRKPGDRGEKKD